MIYDFPLSQNRFVVKHVCYLLGFFILTSVNSLIKLNFRKNFHQMIRRRQASNSFSPSSVAHLKRAACSYCNTVQQKHNCPIAKSIAKRKRLPIHKTLKSLRQARTIRSTFQNLRLTYMKEKFSTYPTVVIVTTAHQNASGMLLNWLVLLSCSA